MNKAASAQLSRTALPYLALASFSQLALSLSSLLQAAALCFSLYNLLRADDSFIFTVLPFLLASGCRFMLENWHQSLLPGLQAKLRNALSLHLLPAFLTAPLVQHEARLHTLSLQGIAALESYYLHYLPLVINAAVICGLCSITLYYAHPASALCLLLCAVLSPLSENLWLYFTKKPASSFFASIARLNQYLHDSLMGIESLKVFHAEQRRYQRLVRLARHLRLQGLLVLRLVLPRNALTGLFGFAGMILAISLAILDFQSQAITAFNLLWVFFFAREMFKAIDALDKTSHMVRAARAAEQQIMAQIRQTVPASAESDSPAPPPDPLSPGTAPGYLLKVEQLTQRWSEQEPALFQHLNFSLQAGQMLAITGASGCGKSSLLNILLGFIDVKQGQINLAGQPITQLQHPQVLQNYSCVFQHFHLFDGSILDNLRLAHAEASMADVVAACELAGIHQEIMQLPEQYASLLGQFGVQLSGGQRQRLALARAWLRPAPILILDESLAQLDSANELAILNRLRRALGQRGLIIVSHHLAHLKLADQILVLSQSAPAELGSHEQLLKLSATYSSLVAAATPV